jgi:hypothetical protein
MTAFATTNAMSIETITTPQEEGFTYVDLNEVDPSFKAIPQDFYTLQVLKAERKEFNYKTDGKSHKKGDTGEYVKFSFLIKNHPEFAGRRLWETGFFSKQFLRGLRLLMDATGVNQVPGEHIDEWFKQLSTDQPDFRTQVLVVPDVDWQGNARSVEKDGVTPKTINKINWKEIIPV